jgi:hypothetical protein
MLAKWAMHTHFDSHISKKDLSPSIQMMLDAGYQGYWGIEFGPGVNEYTEVDWVLAAIKRDLAKMSLTPAS